MATDITTLHANPDERKRRARKRPERCTHAEVIERDDGVRVCAACRLPVRDRTERALDARRAPVLDPGAGSGSDVDSIAPATSVSDARSFEVPADWWPVIDAVWTARHRSTAQRWRARARSARKLHSLAAALNAEHAYICEADRERSDEFAPVFAAACSCSRCVAAAPRSARHDGWSPGIVDGKQRHMRSARYAVARARTIALDRSAVVAACGDRSMVLLCKCGRTRKRIGCGQPWLCDVCRRRVYGRQQRRAMRAISVHLASARAAWEREGAIRGREPRPYLVTFTVPHGRKCAACTAPSTAKRKPPCTCSLDARRRQLVEGWRRFRQWLHGKLQALYGDGRGAFPFVGMPELTAGLCDACRERERETALDAARIAECKQADGTISRTEVAYKKSRKYVCEHGGDGTGHLHLHVVVIWPWWDWKGDDEHRGIAAEWRAAVGDPSANPPDIRACHEGNGAKQAARYVAKYATKGANYTHTGIGPELLAEMVAIYYGKRRTLPSVGFWTPCKTNECRCPKCGIRPEIIEWPERLASIDPGRAWLALGRAFGVAVAPRGSPARALPRRSAGALW